jgi:hypothetical protein
MAISMANEENVVAPASAAAPGTEILYDSGISGITNSNLQYVQAGGGHVLLVPQPSLTDWRDPLRWPRWRKWMVLFNGCWYSFNGAVTGPIMAAGMFSKHYFSRPLTLGRNDGTFSKVQHFAATADIRQWCNSCISRSSDDNLDVSASLQI